MAAAKKVARKKQSPPRTGTQKAVKKLPKPPARKQKTAAPRARSRKTPRPKKKAATLGRVRVAADARLDLVFQKDYQAREIFGFLKVQTLRELEQLSHEEILDRLAGPMFQTVQRIRKALALANRHLAKDEKFAKAFWAEVKKTR